MKKRRGTCPDCGFRFRLLKDGVTIQSHKLYASDLKGFYCSGGGKLAVATSEQTP